MASVFHVHKVVVVQQGSRLRWCWEFTCCRSSSTRRTCCLMSPWWTCRERPISKADAYRFHQIVCTVADELSLPLLENCKASRASSPNWPSQPFLTRFIGHGNFWVAAVCFRAWFSFGTEFFSLLQPRDRFFFFFFSVVHACAAGPNLPGRQKSDTASCHWQREVNVMRRLLPRTTGRTLEWIELRAGIPPPSCTCRSRYSCNWIWRTVATTSWKCFSFFV